MSQFESLVTIERELSSKNLVLFDKYYALPPGEKSKNGVVIAGYCGYFFVTDGSNHWENQIFGNISLSERGVNAWQHLLQQRLEKANALNIQIVHTVVPEKQLIFPMFRWKRNARDWGDPNIDYDFKKRPIKTILNVLPSGLKFIYPIDLLRALQPYCELYYRGDSHWCASGCLAVGLELLRSLVSPALVEQLSFRFERSTVRHDLMMHFYAPPPMEEIITFVDNWFSLIYASDQLRRTGVHNGMRYILLNKNALQQDKVAVYGDSYSLDTGLTNVISWMFREVHFFNSRNINWNYLTANNIKYLIWQSAERFMGSVPVV
ncbi:hypothetical protein [Candidatus Magnetaquicoccus inordinatus]|uniref:hypothetical protein n=1 Tax=Candidatus Magnetaquicoccus inordinatus TaxID=2496818 RepID=UPI00102CC7FB|nr:hypothetical protein [Candidatus Magnetaquicoccus inordinatus]